MGVLSNFTRPLGVLALKRAGQRDFSNVGFVGLGVMGGFMAKNLLKKGYKLTVYDINEEAVSKVVNAGAKGAKNVAEVSKNSEIVVTMLPMNQHVLEAYTGENGIISAANKGTYLVDSSTIDPSVAQEVAKAAEQKGLKFIDGPVTGAVYGAENAKLTFLIGGSKSDYENTKDFLGAMGSRAVHCGSVGMGQVAKICNNMILAISTIGVSEAFNIGDKLGLDPKILLDVINTGSARCWASEINTPVPGLKPNVPSSNGYAGGFRTVLMAKDLGLAQTVAAKAGSPIPLGSLTHQIYRTMVAHGLSDKDFSVVYKFLHGEGK